jgi:hypothetical protein
MASDYENRLRQIAEEEGMPWDVVRRVIQSEGGFKDPFQRSLGSQGGVQEYSLGPLQLNMRKGVGVEAKKAGFDAASDWEGAYRFGLNWAKKHGWGDWMGARKIGLASGKGDGGGGGQYNLKPRRPADQFWPGSGQAELAAAQPSSSDGGTTGGTTVAGGGGYTPLPLPGAAKPKSRGDVLGEGFQSLADAMTFKPLPIPEQRPSSMMGGGAPLPSVFRPQLMPTSVGGGMGGMGGGQDLRAMLAQLMGGMA